MPLVGLRMPRALEVPDHTMQQLERGEIGAVEAINTLLASASTSEPVSGCAVAD